MKTKLQKRSVTKINGPLRVDSPLALLQSLFMCLCRKYSSFTVVMILTLALGIARAQPQPESKQTPTKRAATRVASISEVAALTATAFSVPAPVVGAAKGEPAATTNPTVTVNPDETEAPLIAVGPGYIAKNVTASGRGWIVNTPDGGNAGGTSPHSTHSGGIGKVQPLQWGWSFDPADGANLWISARKWNAQAQALFVYKGKGCDTCNAMAFDQTITAVGGPTANQDDEMDISANIAASADAPDMLAMGGFECNQLKRNAAFGHWMVDAEQLPWVKTSLTIDCPPPPGTEVGLMITWDRTDLSLGPYGTTTFQYAWFNGVRYPIGIKVPSWTEKGWGSYAGFQHQLYVSGSSKTGDAVTTANRLIKNDTYIVGIFDPNSTSTANPALQ